MPLVPSVNTLWRFKGHGDAHGDIQRVVMVTELDITTVTETVGWGRAVWSGLWPIEDFVKNHMFVGNAPQQA
jgi:predicted TIM-barrel fold metal-dependent hydrolase